MRTQQEIVDRIETLKDVDLFGFEINDLIMRLDFAHAKQFLKDSIVEEEWVVSSADPEEVKKEMREYMPFAWEKANNFRGLSAARSMVHYTTWIWLCGDEDIFGDLGNYEYYGKDNLVKICEYYGWDHTQWDDGIRQNSE